MPGYQKKKVLITVKTYPTPARKGVEVSCTAGITDAVAWIRLFPIPFRYLEGKQQFSKYQWIEVDAKKCSSDPRPESYEINYDSVRVASETLSTNDAWKKRKEIVLPLLTPSLCFLHKTRKKTGATLGIFKPKVIHKFIIEPDTPDWSPEQRQNLLQQSFYDNRPLQPLEKIPYKFSYRFTCNDISCRGHKLMCVDWELGAAYREWKKKYGNDWKSAIESRFETDMILRYDTHFFVGTMRGHPDRWIIVGLFYPPLTSS